MSRKPEEFKDGYLEFQPISLYPEYTDFASELRNQLVRTGCLTSQETLRLDSLFLPQVFIHSKTVTLLQDVGLNVSGQSFPLVFVCPPALRDEEKYLAISAKDKRGRPDKVSLGFDDIIPSLWDLSPVELPFPKRCPETGVIYIDGAQYQDNSLVRVDGRNLPLGSLPNGLQDKGREGVLLVVVDERRYDGLTRQWEKGAVQITALAAPRKWQDLFLEGRLVEPLAPLDRVLPPEELARLIAIAPNTAFSYVRERILGGIGDRKGRNAAFPLYEGPVRVKEGTRKAILGEKKTSVRILILPNNTIRFVFLSLDLEAVERCCRSAATLPQASLMLECFSSSVEENKAGNLVVTATLEKSNLQIEAEIKKWDGISEFVRLENHSIFATECVGSSTGLAILFCQLRPPIPIVKPEGKTRYFW